MRTVSGNDFEELGIFRPSSAEQDFPLIVHLGFQLD